MNQSSRRTFLTGLVAVPGLAGLLAACGSDAPSAGEPQDDPPTVPSDPTTGAGDGGTVPVTLSPDAADEVRLRIDTGVGAFTTAEMAFARTPALLVMGDGTAYRPGPQIEIYPGPLAPAIERGSISADALQALMAEAGEAGLLAAPPDYTVGQPLVTDVGETVVTLGTGDGPPFVHAAYALGFDDETSPARRTLDGFVDRALSTVITGGVVYAAERFAIWANPVDPSTYRTEPAPTIVAWPETAGDLASATTCLLVAAPDVGDLLAAATQLTLFEQAGRTYAVAVRPVLPGSPACP